MDASCESSAVAGSTASSGAARRRTTPRIGGLDSPPYSNISLASPNLAPEIAYVRSPFRLFSLYGSATDDGTLTPRVPDTPAIRIVPPRDESWEPPVEMQRSGSSGSSSIYSTDSSSDHSYATTTAWSSLSRGSTKKSDISLSSATTTLVNSLWSEKAGSEPRKPEASRHSTIRSAWSTLTSPKAIWSSSRSPTFQHSPTPAQIVKMANHPRWTKLKWILLLSIATLLVYGAVGLCLAIVTWTRAWTLSEVVVLTDTEILAYLTLASVLCLLTALVGLVGAMLNSRPILTFYNILLWPTFIAILSIGYSSYRRSHLGLDRKLNQAWSQQYSDLARLRIQYNLGCCGYFNSLHQATFSQSCYPRSMLPGCKGSLLDFQGVLLRRSYIAAFLIAPFHLINIFAAVLCSNHVSTWFGKNLAPHYARLTTEDVRQVLLAEKAPASSPEQFEDVELDSEDDDLPRIPTARLHGLGLTHPHDT